MGEVKWEDPPGVSRGAWEWGKWVKALEPLMERPGCWANMGEVGTSVPNQLRRAAQGKTEAVKLPPGRWEFTQRVVKGAVKRATLYARYLGE